MSLFKRLLAGNRDNRALIPLYNAIVAAARAPHWYVEGEIPDTMDGRFDMIAALTALVLLRLERDDDAREESAFLAELFVDDMDGQLRELGIGDVVVGKHIGRMMGALGGRLGAFRDALNADEPLDAAIHRNLYREAPVAPAAMAHAREQLLAVWRDLQGRSTPAILKGNIA